MVSTGKICHGSVDDQAEMAVLLPQSTVHHLCTIVGKGKGKVPPYSLPSVGPGADPGVQAVSPQVTLSHPPGGRLPLLSTGPTVTFPAEERHRPSAGTKIILLGDRGTCV